MEFIDFLGDKGLMNSQTAASRKASVSSLLSILDDIEAADVSKLDLDQVTQRFLNKRGSSFKLESVKLYKARTESAIRDFLAYKRDPLGFKPELGQRSPRKAEGKQKGDGAVQQHEAGRATQTQPPFLQSDSLVFPIPIRSDVTVKVAGIPSDLTLAEAQKISKVIIALAISNDI